MENLNKSEEKNITNMTSTRRFIKGFVTQLYSISLNFGMLLISIFINMKISPILFATAIWLGMQDSFWMTTLKDGEDRKSLPQFEMKFYHYSRMWVYTFAFLSFVIEYLIKMFV